MKAKVASVERQVQRLLNHDTGELRIGVGPIIEQILLPEVLTTMLGHSGSVQLSVLTEHADVLLSQLINAQLDVIAGPFDASDPDLAAEGITAIELISDTTISVVRAGHPLVIAPDNHKVREFPFAAPAMQGAMRKDNPQITERNSLSWDNYTMLKQILLQTDCICAGPRDIFRQELNSGQVLHLPYIRGARLQSACLVREEALSTPLVQLFCDTIAQASRAYIARQHQD